jgi:xanthine/uracil permease
VANISVLLGIVAGCVVAAAMGKMHFDKVAKAALVRRRHALRLRHAHLRPVMILTMTLVMIVVMIESTGMFLALPTSPASASASRAGRRAAHRRPGHADRRPLQHLPLHQLLAERGPGGRHRA